MFFIGVMGLGNRSEQLRGGIAADCSGCGKKVYLTLSVTYEYFHFFFIPVFKFHRQYYAVCSNCGSLFQVEESAAREVLSGRLNKLRPEQLTLLRGKNAASPVCPYCGTRNPAGSSFCNNCGRRL